MDGVLIIDKPAGITSHDVVDKVRRILRTKRVGHTGTLDPFATGVMVVLTGKATRLAQYLDKDEKEYLATLKFGFETDTGDRTGRPIAGAAGDLGASDIDRHKLETVIRGFLGETQQVPPMYSAKKIDGKKLYEHARNGLEIEREPVTVSIKSIEISEQEPSHGETVTLRVACSAGTYIRVLAQDIGRRLGFPAHLEELRRIWAGRFTLDESLTLESLAKMDDPSGALLPLESAVEHLPQIRLAADRVARTRSGLSSLVIVDDLADAAVVGLLDEHNCLVAVGTYDAREKSVRPKIVLI